MLQSLLARADIRINGHRPWDIQVHDARLYRRLLTQCSLGAGESCLDGDWDCERLDEMFTRLLCADLVKQAPGWSRLALLCEVLRQHWINRQTPRRAFEVGERHNDVGNDVFEAMLDCRMVCSSGYRAQAATQEEAQADKRS